MIFRALPDSDLDIMVECNENLNYLKVVEKVGIILVFYCRFCASAALPVVS